MLFAPGRLANEPRMRKTRVGDLQNKELRRRKLTDRARSKRFSEQRAALSNIRQAFESHRISETLRVRVRQRIPKASAQINVPRDRSFTVETSCICLDAQQTRTHYRNALT